MKSKKVLIADNNDLSRKLLENLIGQSYQVQTVKNSIEAVEAACREKFDLMLMDIQLPGIDGISTAKNIWRKSPFSCPIIAISNYTSTFTRKCFLEMGFADMLTKPVKPKELLQVISDITADTVPDGEHLSFSETREILDLKVFSQLSKYNPKEKITAFYADFLEEFDQLMLQIEAGLADKNKKIIVDKLHTIKGNSGSLGARKLYAFSTQADKEARGENWGAVELLMKKLKNERMIFERYLEEETIFKV